MNTPHPLKAGYKAAILWTAARSLSLLWRISLYVLIYQFVAIGSKSSEANNAEFALAFYSFFIAIVGTLLARWLLSVWMRTQVIKISSPALQSPADEQPVAIADLVVRILRALIAVVGVAALNPILENAELTTAITSLVVVAAVLILGKIYIQNLQGLLSAKHRWMTRITLAEAIAVLAAALLPHPQVLASMEFFQYLAVWGAWIVIFYGIRWILRLYTNGFAYHPSQSI
ncbi:hypothetical protein [Glutamicibacter sp. NPDC090743]|uniref:hypothetical protein n=1 Tax=Glutamicibacter sp. NPDC090743 TaxID=3364001 RepID=UPI00381893EC